VIVSTKPAPNSGHSQSKARAYQSGDCQIKRGTFDGAAVTSINAEQIREGQAMSVYKLRSAAQFEEAFTGLARPTQR